MTFPRLGVVTGVERADAVAPLLQALFDRCHVVAWHPGLPVDAVFVASWRAPRALEATREVRGRLVLWETRDPPPQEWRERATLTISTPDPAVDVRHFRATAPFIRERWRGRFEIELPVELPYGPHLATAAHVPRAVSSGRCNRNHCARGAGLRDATGDGLGDCLTARRNRPRRHARVRRWTCGRGRAGRGTRARPSTGSRARTRRTPLGRSAPRSQQSRGRGDPSPWVGGRGRARDRSPRRPADAASVSSDHPSGSPRARNSVAV